ncbi:MAG: redoxin domain-containing protein, partial [Methanoculleus sp.]
QNGNTVRLSAFAGRRVLLSFHPLAWTRICAEQMKALEMNREAFDTLGAVAFGISVDSVPCKRAWAGSLGITKTRLLADFWPHGAVAQAYGVFDSRKGYARRANIVVDETGRIVFVAEYRPTAVPDMQDVLTVLRTPEI